MWRDKLVIPHVLRNKVLTIWHDSPLSGHFAEKRTLEKFSKLYFWPYALKDVRSWVRSCLKCNQFNPPRPGYLRGPLQPIKTDHVFQIVCFDIAGPFFPPSSRGNQYVLIIVDHFSNWTEFVPLKTIDAVSIARSLLDNWCCRYGVPERFHSDGASNVHGNVIHELCLLIGAGKSKSSRLHPQGDGQAEAFVKILKNCLIKHVEKNVLDWDLYLQSTAFAVRTSTSTSTGFAPCDLVLGRKLRSAIDFFIDSDHNTTGQSSSFGKKQARQFVNELMLKLKENTDLAKTSLKKSHMRQKEQYIKKCSKINITVNDNVMLRYPYAKKGISRCFVPKWNGPWTVLRFNGPSNCNIKNAEGKIKYVNVDQLKKIEVRANNSSNGDRFGNNDMRRTDENENENETSQNLNDDELDISDDFQDITMRYDENEMSQNPGSWCDIDANNVLPHRTRSGRV